MNVRKLSGMILNSVKSAVSSASVKKMIENELFFKTGIEVRIQVCDLLPCKLECA